jgi:hypothetical protein
MTDPIREPWSPRGDPILKLLPAERPWAFDKLDFEDQKWRARIMLAVWIETGGAANGTARLAFAWSNAMDPTYTAAEREWVLQNFTDEVILDGLKSLEEPAPEATE